MVIAIIIAAFLVAAGIYKVQEFRIGQLQAQAEHYKDCYQDMASDNIDLRIKLQDAQEAYSNLICQRAMGWAGEEVSRMH
jgi:hypothetical protein